MYTAFYGLREKPFALSPDPRFLYLAGSHREALAHLLYGIEQGEGFISVTGEVGTGKTTLCRTLLERLEGDLELAFLFNPSRTALELLQSICAEFDLPAEGLTRRSLMTQLNAFLVEQKKNGRRVLLIIDEAQTLSENTLEQVRLLSNLETSREKLIQILLLGQPELDRKLDGRGLRQLRQRISVRWQLDPLSPTETRAYVRHRLSVAAGEPKDLFSEAALREVHRRTGGIPRLVNQLCDRALLAGYATRAAKIGPALVRTAALEIPDARRRSERPASARPSIFRPWMLLAGVFALVALALFAGLQVGRHGLTDAMRASVFKTQALAGPSDDDRVPPAVGANAPRDASPASSAANAAGLADPPSLGRLIGYVPNEIRENLRPNPGQLEAPPTSNLPSGRAANALQPNINSLAPNLSEETLAGVVPASSSIPERPDAAIITIAPGLLAGLLENRDGRTSMADSQRAALARFGRASGGPSAPSDAEALRMNIESRGLVATPFDGGSLDLIRRLEHPVLMPLVAHRATSPDGITPLARGIAPSAQRWLAITGFEDGRAHVAGLVPDRIATIPISELESHWLETGIIVWQRFEKIPPLLAAGAKGQSVFWIQRALSELRFFEGRPTGQYDADTLSAVADFQRERGLVADGVAGPLTQIALYGQLDRYPVPRLSASGAHSPSGSPSAAAPARAAAPRSQSGDRG